VNDSGGFRRQEKILLAQILGVKNPLLLDPNKPLTPEQARKFEAGRLRIESGEPLQYILGEWDFFGRTFRVDPRALIPRPETEHLVEEALRETRFPRRVLDLGCGSGILAVSLALECPAARLVAVDSSVAALALSSENSRRHGVLDRVALLCSDWVTALSGIRFDLAVANPPYVSTRERETLPENVRLFEPHSALFAGDEGLAEIRELLDVLPPFLSPGAPFLLEFGFGQREPLKREISDRNHWELVRFVDDLAGIPRVAVLRRALRA
jgi:release factor glutamine methyltransferase